MTQKLGLLGIVMLMPLLVSCMTKPADNLTPPTTLLTTTEDQITPSFSPTFTTSPTSTAAPTATPQPTLTPTITSTPLPITDIQYQEIEIESSISSEIGGALILGNPQNSNENSIWDLDTGTEISFPDRVYGVRLTSISPNRELLAYFDWYQDQLQIATAHGQTVFSYPIQDNWGQIIGWLDHERLAINTRQYDGIQIIFNAFTGEWQELPPSFPYVSEDGEIVRFDSPDFDEEDAIYDPTISMAIIKRFSRDENRGTLELWNHLSEHAIWKETNVRVQSRAFWAPDGNSFAVVYVSDAELFATTPTNTDAISLYVINQEGIATRLTSRVLGGATWSPDGRYIAILWQKPKEFGDKFNRAYAFAVVDTIARKITVYSIISASGYHVWSPDGRYVALDNVLEYGDEPEDTKTQVVIVDLVENRAFALDTEAKVVGWMIQSP